LNAYSELNEFAKYNFFTSSFYNGLDIITDKMPDIIMLTDVKSIQTVLDPLTDVVQIVGRFRDDDQGKRTFNKVNHFYTTNWKLNLFDPEKSKLKVELNCLIYDAAKAIVRSNPRYEKDEELKSIYDQELRRLLFSQFLTKNQTDYFKIDNFLNDERVRSYYKSKDALIEAYNQENQRAFIPTFLTNTHIPGNGDHLNLKGGRRYSIENVHRVVNALFALEHFKDSQEYKDIIKYYREHANDVLQCYLKLGYEAIKNLGFKINAIRKAIIVADFEAKRNHYPLIDAIHLRFSLNKFYPLSDIKIILQNIYDEFGLTDFPALGTHIEHYFDCTECKKKVTGKQARGYFLNSHKQLAYPDYERT